MAAAAIAGAAIDFGARATWAGLNETQFATHWDAYVGSGELRARCPKVGIGYFYYPSLGRKLRGAMAKAPIAKGERLCEVPVGSLLSTFSVGNSTLRPVMDAVEAEASAPIETSVDKLRGDGRKRKKVRATDKRAFMCLLVLREAARARSAMMPYISVLLSHDVSGVPMTWGPNSDRLHRATPALRAMAALSRASTLRNYEAVVPLALSRFGHLLSEGLDCAGAGATASCSREQLERIYSREEFLRVFAIFAARDWVLPMYGKARAFCVPIIDMFNFGQVGIRAEFDERAHAFVATATQPIKAGTELLFYYGTMCRESWIVMYGFAPREARPCREPTKPGETGKLGALKAVGGSASKASGGKASAKASAKAMLQQG